MFMKVRKRIYSMFMLRHSSRVVRNSLLITFTILCLVIIGKIPSQEKTVPLSISQNNNTNMSYYLQSVEYRGKNVCKNTTEVVIGIISSPSNFKEREAIRNSWGKDIPSNWCLFFFVGKQSLTGKKEELKREEQREDVIETNVTDLYENLTIKVGLLFNWVLNNCLQSKYFIKIDDDIFINTGNMKHFLENCIKSNSTKLQTKPSCKFESISVDQYKHKSGKSLEYVAVGFLYRNLSPIRDPTSKWYLDKSVFSNSVIPNFLSGTCYLITTNLLPAIMGNVIHVPLINLEDVYFTGLIMSSRMNLKLRNNDKWNNFRPWFSDPCYFNSLITAHGLKSHELIEMAEAVNRLNSDHCNHLFHNIFMQINKYLSYYFPKT